MKKLTLEEAKKRAKENGFIFLDKEYRGNKHAHRFRCIKDDEIHLSRFNDIDQGHGLICCKRRLDSVKTKNRIRGWLKSADSRKLDLDSVKKICIKRGYEFLDKKYINIDHVHRFRCLKHNKICRRTFWHVSSGQRLICCKRIYRGKESPSWNNNLTDEERRIKRTGSGDIKWRQEIKSRDGYKCQICFRKYKNVHAHHIESYASNKNLRLEINNGVTLCVKHHKQFHKIYGLGNNTRYQFEQFQRRKNGTSQDR